jgi:hypothetical protein
MSKLNNLLKRQKQLEDMEKKLAQDKKDMKAKISSLLRKKREKENCKVGAAIRNLFADKKDFTLEKIEEICLKNFGEQRK